MKPTELFKNKLYETKKTTRERSKTNMRNQGSIWNLIIPDFVNQRSVLLNMELILHVVNADLQLHSGLMKILHETSNEPMDYLKSRLHAIENNTIIKTNFPCYLTKRSAVNIQIYDTFILLALLNLVSLYCDSLE